MSRYTGNTWQNGGGEDYEQRTVERLGRSVGDVSYSRPVNEGAHSTSMMIVTGIVDWLYVSSCHYRWTVTRPKSCKHACIRLRFTRRTHPQSTQYLTLRKLGRRISSKFQEERHVAHLFHKLLVTVQRLVTDLMPLFYTTASSLHQVRTSGHRLNSF